MHSTRGIHVNLRSQTTRPLCDVIKSVINDEEYKLCKYSFNMVLGRSLEVLE